MCWTVMTRQLLCFAVFRSRWTCCECVLSGDGDVLRIVKAALRCPWSALKNERPVSSGMISTVRYDKRHTIALCGCERVSEAAMTFAVNHEYTQAVTSWDQPYPIFRLSSLRRHRLVTCRSALDGLYIRAWKWRH